MIGRASRFLASLSGSGGDRGRSGDPLHVGRDVHGADIAVAPADLRRGVVVHGGSEGDRLAALLTLAEGAIARGGGAVIVHRAGGATFREAVSRLARRHAREDDLAWLDLARDAADTDAFNPLHAGRPDEIVDTVVAFAFNSGDGGRPMWGGRARSVLDGLVRLLCWDRDIHGKPFGLEALHAGIGFRALFDATQRTGFGEGAEAIEALRGYMGSIPGFQWDRRYDQPQTTLDQHGYLQHALSGALVGLVGRPALSGRGTVDVADVVRGRRILAVCDPAAADDGRAVGYVMAAAMRALEAEGRGEILGGVIRSLDAEGGAAANRDAAIDGTGLPFLIAYSGADVGCEPLAPLLHGKGIPAGLACAIEAIPGFDLPSYTVVDTMLRALGTKLDLGAVIEDSVASGGGKAFSPGRPAPAAYPVEVSAPALSREAWLGCHAPLSLDRETRWARIAQSLEAQLGGKEDDLPVGLLAAALLAYAAGRGAGSPDADAAIVRLAKAMRLPEPARSAALRTLARDLPGPAEPEAGAFASTRALAAFEAARKAGLGSGTFAWLRSHRRPLWFALNGYGRPEPWAEGLGILAHRQAERAAGGPVVIPAVRSTADALLELSVAIERGRR